MNTRTKPRVKKVLSVDVEQYLKDGQVATERDMDTIRHVLKTGQYHLVTAHLAAKLHAAVARLGNELDERNRKTQEIVNEYDAEVNRLKGTVTSREQSLAEVMEAKEKLSAEVIKLEDTVRLRNESLRVQSEAIQEAFQRAQKLEERIRALETKVREIEAQKGSQEPQEAIQTPSTQEAE